MPKIAISMPDYYLRFIDKARLASGETRSQFLRRVIAEFFKQKRDRELDEQYIRAYRDMPETAEDVEGSYLAGLDALAEDPWEDRGKE